MQSNCVSSSIVRGMIADLGGNYVRLVSFAITANLSIPSACVAPELCTIITGETIAKLKTIAEDTEQTAHYFGKRKHLAKYFRNHSFVSFTASAVA